MDGTDGSIRAHGRHDGQARLRDAGGNTLAAIGLSYLIAVALIVALVHNGGIWNQLANTRLLAPLVDGGFIALTDQDQGLLVSNGVPDLTYWMKSQDPVDWLLVLLAAVLFGVLWAIKCVQFHRLARFAGLGGGFGRHSRAYLYGKGIDRVLPSKAGEVATATALEGQGVPVERGAQLVWLMSLFAIFEAATFALIGLVLNGFNTWITQLFWPFVILAFAYVLARRGRTRAERRENRRRATADARMAFRALAQRPRMLAALAALSLLSFYLLELTCYVVAQAFTSANVVLNVEFGVLLMGVVGGYVAKAIPVTPGGLGQWEWGMASALYLGGLGFPESVTLPILITVIRYFVGGLVFAAVIVAGRSETSVGRVLSVLGRRADPVVEPQA